jgi:hypothetical protein
MALLLEDYFLDVQNTVRTRAVADGSFTQPAFTHEMADRLSVADEVDSLSVYSLETTGSRNRRIAVDGVGIDDEENQVVLVISDHRSSDEIETLTTTEAKRHFGALQAFLETAMDGSYSSRFDPSSPAYADAESIHELRARGELDKVRLYLLSNAQLSDSIRSFPSEKHDGVEVEFHIWGIERFHRVELSQLGREELDIDLTEWVADGLPALPACEHLRALRVAGTRVERQGIPHQQGQGQQGHPGNPSPGPRVVPSLQQRHHGHGFRNHDLTVSRHIGNHGDS